jgi:hypothetical protein
MCDYTLTLVDCCDGRLKPQSLSVLAGRRNYVQHSLMSLLADSESKGMVQAANPFYEYNSSRIPCGRASHGCVS